MRKIKPPERWLEPENLILIEGWARDGLTNDQIAKNMGLSRSTFYKLQKESMDFLNALKKGKEVTDREVENALLKRALGYEYEEQKRKKIKKADGSEEMMVEKTIKKVAPDVTAQIFWLKNRKPDVWRDKQVREISTVEDLTPLADLINADDE